MGESNLSIFKKGIWSENPTFRMVLGICPTLAVTNLVENSLAMSAGVLFVLVCVSLTVSLIREFVPRRVRMAVYTVIIATYVVFVDLFLKIYFPRISGQIGPYVGLIITNCIIMGRAEAFASSNPPLKSALDAVGAGLGLAFSLIAISGVREGLGFGTVLGFRIMGDAWTPWLLLMMPPGAFLVLGSYIWILRSIQKS